MNSVDLRDLFAAIDERPFQPFVLELVSGRKVPVTHPDNIVIGPTREKVFNISVYQTDPYEMALIWPESLVGLLYSTPEIY